MQLIDTSFTPLSPAEIAKLRQERERRGQGTSPAPPAPKGGVVGRLREEMGGYAGPDFVPGSAYERDLEAERVKSGPPSIRLPAFLPYFDDVTGETAAIRAAYRQMLADPNVKAASLGKLFGVASLDLQVVPANEHDDQDRAVAKFVEWTLSERLYGGMTDLIWNILIGGLVDGVSINEKVWNLEDRGRYAGKIALAKFKPQDVGKTIIPKTDEHRNIVSLMGLRYNGGQFFDPRDFIIYQHQPLFGSPVGTSDLRAAYGRYWLLDTTLKIRAMGIDKRALPLLVGTYKDPLTKPTLDDALNKAKSNRWMSVPEGVRVEAINIAGQADNIFAETIKDLKHDIFLGIAGAFLQQLEGSLNDGRGNSKIQASTADLFKWFLSKQIETVLNNHDNGLIRDTVDLNYVVRDYPKATLSGIDPMELAADLNIVQGLHVMNLPLSKKWVYKKFMAVPPKDESDALTGVPPGGQMPSDLPGGLKVGFADTNAEVDIFTKRTRSGGGAAATPFQSLAEFNARAFAERQQSRPADGLDLNSQWDSYAAAEV